MNLKVLVFFCAVVSAVFAESKKTPDNPFIDAPEHLAAVSTAIEIREKRRISEEDFLRMSAEPNTVVLDARSAEMFQRLHVRGAVNLSFPDFTAETLAKVIPTKNTRVLIYCNNNFLNSPAAFPAKAFSVALNLSTFTNLHAYGYTNVYELGPLLDVTTTKLKLVDADFPEALNKP